MLQAELGTSHWREAQSLFRQGNYIKAMNLLEKHFERLSFRQKQLLLKTYGKLQKKNRQLHLLNGLLKSHPKNTYVLTSLGNVLLSMGGDKNKIEAVQLFRKALRINPNYLFAYQGLIRVFKKNMDTRGDHRYELREIYKSMTKVQAKPGYYRQLCYLSWVDSFWRDVKKYCARAKEKEPQVAGNHVYFALALINDGRNPGSGSSSKASLQKGLSQLKKVAYRFPKSELAWVTYGDQLQQNREYVVAKQVFSRAVQTHASSLLAWAGLAESHFALGEYNLSLKASLKACRIHPQKGQLAVKKLIYSLSQVPARSLEKKWIPRFYSASDDCIKLKH